MVSTSKPTRDFKGLQNLPCWAEFSPDGQYVAGRCLGKMVFLWSCESGKKVASCKHPKDVQSSCFLPAHGLATGAADSKVRLFAPQGQELACHKPGARMDLRCMACDSGSNLVIGGGTTLVMDLLTGSHLASFAVGNLVNLSLSHQARYLVTCHYSWLLRKPDPAAEEDIKVWEVSSGTLLGRVRTEGFAAQARISPDGTRLWAFPQGPPPGVSQQPRPVTLWEVASGRRLGELPLQSSLPTILGDGRLLIYRAGIGIGLYDQTGSRLIHLFPAAQGEAMTVSPDGRWLCACRDDEGKSVLSLWEMP